MNNVERAPEREKAPLLSIIVPVYKVENYLPKCIDSILAQTFTDFELILVDDGSPDDCPALCDATAEKDARVRVIHQKNGGLSAARNAGLDAARGAWIGFVDSDDYIEPEMYEVLYQAVQSTGADLALCDYAEVDEAGKPCPPMHVSLSEGELTGQKLLKRASGLMVQLAWNKLYRRAIFTQLRYPEGKLNEDLFLIPEVCLQIQKAVVVPKALYYYVQRGGSIMNESKTLRHYDAAEAAQRYWDCLVENAAYDARHCARHPAAGKCCGCSLRWSTAPGGTAPFRADFGCKAGCCGTFRRHTVGCGNSRAEEKEKNA